MKVQYYKDNVHVCTVMPIALENEVLGVSQIFSVYGLTTQKGMVGNIYKAKGVGVGGAS